jgi:mono/diheme cytochrome c family protein
MSKKVFIAFGLVIAFLAVAVPFLVFDSNGDATSNGQNVPPSLQEGQELFQVNCGTCHTLHSAGTDGNYGPNLDELLAPNGPATDKSTIETTENLVLSAVKEGLDTSTTPGRMPAGILNEEQTKEVAEFVARTAGEG